MTDRLVHVTTASGEVRGAVRDGVLSVLGIPYAATPAGALRFAAPAPRSPWTGVHDGTRFGAAAPQLPPAPGVPPSWRPGDGLDCLTLNVWTPDPGAAGLPVMVWIHGGLWKHGASRMPQYDATALAASGVVVVTVNYRLGFEGFGHVPGMAENRGLRDQVAALEWVRDNVAAFGGDPGNVTAFGQSAGAASVVLLMAAPAARGLFHKAIAQSVPAGCLRPDDAAAVTATIAGAAGVAPTLDGLASLSPEAILAVQDVPLRGRASQTAFGPVIDGDVVTGPPWAALESGAGREIDLVCGFTHDEFLGHGPVPDDLDAVAAAVGLGPAAAAVYREAAADGAVTAMLSDALVRMPTTWVADAHAGAGGRTWLYDFAWRGSAMGAAHGADLPFVFGDRTSRFAARFLGTPPPADFDALSQRVRAAWTGFAATGDPGWPRYDTAARRTMVWDTRPSIVDDLLAALRPLWAATRR